MTNTTDAGPAWKTVVIQGTIAEDATAGTHVCTLTVTPGAGNEMQLGGGMIIDGNTATAQTEQAYVTDGTNVLFYLGNASAASSTTASQPLLLPESQGILAGTAQQTITSVPAVISGTMKLVLQVTTVAVSVTHTFSACLRVRGLYTPTFADTVGTPTITTNTSQVF